MASCELLDEALRIGTQELDALRSGDVELADQCCAKRDALTEEALRGGVHETLRTRLEALQDLQKELYAEAKKRKLEIQDSLSASRKQTQRMRGYGLAVRQAQQI
ncbi:MAG: hypothetical protein RRY20_04675 [Bilophila sp.]